LSKRNGIKAILAKRLHIILLGYFIEIGIEIENLKMDSYTPVSCAFHDELEAIATLRQSCRIVYRTDAGTTSEISGQIVDVFAANHAEYVKLEDGTLIRLDQIASVNDTVASCTDEFS
jgi:Rho-binding antiterminator